MNETPNISTPPQPPLVIPDVSRCPSSIVYLEDCVQGLKRFADKYFDVAIVDPPYGWGDAFFGLTATPKARKNKRVKKHETKDWNEPPKKEYWNELWRVSKNQIVWGGNYFTDYLHPSMGWIMWDKGQRDFSLADGELAWTSFNKALRVYEYSRAKLNNNRGGLHPTEKPIDLYRWILQKYANEGDKILDTHGGSMTIAHACDKEGFDLDICELDKEYFEAGLKRYNEYKQQTTLF